MSLADTLRRTLRERLVGRDAERARFAGALTAETLPVHIIHVYGPGGVGKTTLLREFERLAVEAGVPAATVDLRDVGPTPDGLALAIRAAFARAGIEAGVDRRHVLLLDTFEAAQDLDGWLQRVFLPEQSSELLVVIAGRHAPIPSWTADAAWASLVATMPLGNLTDEEAAAFLAHDVPPEAQADVLALTHGYPLALALVAERFRQNPGRPFVLADAPDVTRMLLERFVHDVPSEAHRTTIEGAALVRALTEPLLAALLADETDTGESPDTHALFGWLRALTFVEDGPRGLVLHDLARETIEADLRWRDPERYAVLHARARRHYAARLLAADATTAKVLGDYVHLYRDNPVVQPLLGPLAGAWRSSDVREPGPMTAAHIPDLVEMVRRHEGDASAEIAAHWFHVQPEATEVFCRADGGIAGFLTALALDETEGADRATDPLAAAAWAAVEGTRRAGERVLLFRFWMDAESYQGLSAIQSLIFARTVQRYLTTPRLAVSLLPTTRGDLWGPALAFAGLARWTEADATIGGTPVETFGMDWRAVPPAAWLDALAARVPNAVPPLPERAPAGGRTVLSREAFDDAVRDALRHLAHPARLAGNPLLRTALVETATGPEADEPARIAALVACLTEAAEALQSTPREAALWNALRLTYVRPAPSQAIAAERLDVPFSTYRRHLTRGIARVADALWQQEVGTGA